MGVDWLDNIDGIKDTSKPVKYLVWKHTGDSYFKIFLVDVEFIELDDLILLETTDGSRFYGRVLDFVRNPDGSISNWQFVSASISNENQNLMINDTREFLSSIENKNNNFYVFVCLKQA